MKFEKKPYMANLILVLIVGSFLTSTIFASFFSFPKLRINLDNVAFDQLLRSFPRQYTNLPVRIVDIDDRSLATQGQWPWSREQMALLTNRLTSAGAKAIVFDVLFSEPDRTSPSMLAAALPEGEARSQLEALPAFDHDAVFARALAASPSVLPIGLVSQKTDAILRKSLPLAVIGTQTLDDVPHYDGAIGSLPVLQDAAPGLATFSFAAESDTVRAVPLISMYDGQAIPGLSLEALRMASGSETIAIKTRAIDHEPHLAIKVGHQIIDTETSGSLRLHYSGHNPVRFVSAAKLFEATVDPAVRDEINGSIILIGTSAVGLSDLRSTPVDSYIPGVEIHAEAIEHMMLGVSLKRPVLVSQFELLGIFVFGCIAMIATGVWGGGVGLGVMASLTAGLVGATVYAFTQHDLLIDPVLPVMSGLIVTVSVAFVRHALIDRNRRRLKQAFSQYLSPTLVEALARNPDSVVLGGEAREITCLFTDLEGFTRFSETVAPPVLVTVMNTYLDGLCQVAKVHDGTVLKLIGDSVHVIFNAPVAQSDHAARALTCAHAMLDFARQFQADQAIQGLTIGRTRIGIATGPAVVGNFGGTTRFDYTAYGDTVNTAARLEAANKTLGTSILVTEATCRAVTTDADRERLRPIGAVQLRGKAEPIDVWELVTDLTPEIDRLAYLKALAALGARDGSGHDVMAAYVRAHPGDVIARMMLDRLADGHDPLILAV